MLDLTVHDLIIIGAGPAGMSAALYAARQNMDFLLIAEKKGGYANYIEELRTFPGITFLSGFGLMKSFSDQLEECKVPINDGEEVRSVKAAKHGFLVTTDIGQYLAKAVIAASGRKFKRLGIKGEKEFNGRGVGYCGVCDSAMHPNKTIVIIGGGHSGLFAAYAMMKIADKVIIIEKGIVETTGKVKEVSKLVRSSPNVKIIKGEALEILGDNHANGVKVRLNSGGSENVYADYVYIQVGYTPNADFLKGFVKLNVDDEIIIDKDNQASVKGIFAAGDATDVPEKQLIVAMGEGAKAALSAINYLSAAPRASL